MDNKQFSELVKKAEKDPAFLHNLLFKPESLSKELSQTIGRRALGALVSKEPGEVVAMTLGIAWCGNTCTSSCDNTCGISCNNTTGFTERFREAVNPFFARASNRLEGCGNTCTTSCENTCGESCGFTTNFTERLGQQVQLFR